MTEITEITEIVDPVEQFILQWGDAHWGVDRSIARIHGFAGWPVPWPHGVAKVGTMDTIACTYPVHTASETWPPMSYAALVGRQWHDLPARTRARFERTRQLTCYRGHVVRSESTLVGRCFRQLARLIGGPLPLGDALGPAAVVVMTVGAGDSAWTRVYRGKGGRHQAIRSVKRFSGSTGLEEYLGCGVCMALRVRTEGCSLVFESCGYYLAFGERRMPLPRWLTPGRLTVRNTDLPAPWFRFSLELTHPWFGVVLRQEAVFEDAP